LVTVMTNCKDCRSHLPDLLLDSAYTTTHPEYKEHLAVCATCRAELAELRATFNVLDEWKAPELSPYFDSRLQARLREAVAAPPEGFWSRTRSFFLFSTGRQLRPALAGALAFALIVGGGSTFVGIHNFTPGVQQPQASATVNDLKIMDNNIQAEQQMDQLLDDSTPSTDDGAAVPTT
jgi:anti-sigma factor RsiW